MSDETIDAPEATPNPNPVLAAVEHHVRLFIKEGEPIVFGRIEGIKEVLEILKMDFLKEGLQELVDKNYDAMKKHIR